MPSYNPRLSKAVLAGTAATIALLAPPQVLAQATPGATANTPSDLQDIVVTGTRRTDRSAADSPSPVDIIGSAEIATQPAANLLDIVKNIIPSFFVSQNTISDASTFVRAPSLRGLPADEILVQINGKRYNRSALVQVYSGGDTALGYGSQGADISAIPSIAVKNLQVLREGATAQYGSDAIGGVLNYTMRDDAGFELQGRYGQYYDNGGDGESRQIAANAGVKLGERGFINVSGEYNKDGETSRGATRPIAVVFAQLNPSLASKLPNYPGPVQNWGSSPSEGYKFLLNSAFEVTDSSRLYLTVNVAHNKGNASFNYRSPISQINPFVVDIGTGTPGLTGVNGIDPVSANGAFTHPAYLTRCPAGNATCPAGGFVKDGNVYNFTTLYPAGFTPRFIGKTDEAYGTLGYKGKTEGGLSYDLSGTLSRNSLKLSMTDSLNQSYGPQSQTNFQFGKLIQTEFDANLDLSYPIEVGLAAPLTLSAGAEYRREQYETTAGDEQSYGAGPYTSQNLYVQTAPGVFARDTVTPTVSFSPAASGYGGTSPGSAGKTKQTNYALYVDAETDLTKALSVGLAGRYEDYNTFGSTVVGKFNAIYKFSDAFSLRGTVGTGFHAPSPGQSATEILTTNFVAGNQVQTGTYQVGNPISQYYGAKGLKPEKSTNFGIGTIIKPVDALTLTIDGYSIRVRDRIGITQPFTVTAADIAKLAALSTVGVGGNVNYFTNGFNTTTKGIDLVGTYRMPALGGNLNLTLAYNYNKSKVTKFDPTVISRTQISDISNFAPKHRLIASGNLQVGDFTFNARENYYSSWSVQTDYPGDKFGAKFTSDLDASYTINDHYTLTLGAINVFNTKPDRISPTTSNPIYALTGSTADGQIYPRSGGPFGINGGFWYARVRIKY